VREELGRWKILLALRSEVIVGKIITIQSVKTSTKNRVRKQKYGQRYITGEDPILKDLDKELFRALEQWPDHPTLRHPGWSHLPAE
jgi:hypothetical protein